MDKNLDILGMTDEDFSKLPAPPTGSTEPDKTETAEKVEEPVVEQNQENTQTVEEKPAVEDGAGEAIVPEDKATSQTEAETDPAATQTAPEPKTEKEPAKAPKPAEKPEEKPDTDFKAFYERVMAPFKANGKMVQLQSPDEVIQLMQMGANYTRKMQAIQPLKKYLMMLENNNLLDESKLSFLIDLDKKNPEAIKKFLKDSNIDPVDIDTSGEVNYKSGSHAVSDQEASLAQTIDDIKLMQGGQETLQSVMAWDQTSKKEILNDPSLLTIIHTHRETGIWDTITSEMEKQKTLGRIAPNTPFLQAYKMVGDALQAAGAFNRIAKPASQAQPAAERVPVATRPAKTPPAAQVDNRVRAAAPPRTASSKAKEAINPLAMSDEDFEKLAKRI